MKGKNLKDLLKQQTMKAGAVVLATALVLGSSMWASDQSGSVPELTKFVDQAGNVEIDAEETPLGNVKVTTSTKTTKKTKKIKLKKKSSKTYSKKSATKKKTKTAKKKTSAATTTTKTVTATSMTSNFKKGSKINTQVTTTQTTVTTTVVANSSAPVQSTSAAGTASTGTASAGTTTSSVPNGPVSLAQAAPKVNANVANAFNTLNFKVNVNSGVTYSGLFDARNQSITLRKMDDTVYHELGHFVAFVAGNADTTPAFQQVFAQEKAKYTAYNKAYVLSSSSEYFAESFKNYTLDPAELKASRPLTYEAIENAVAAVTPQQVSKLKMVYGSIWS
ncbi:MAG: hypothetical protein ACI4EI_03035 [Muricoprocola sp.]